MATNSERVFPAERVEGPRKSGWYRAQDRVLARMVKYAGKPVAPFNPHDLRRTARSNTKRLKVDYETAEAMLNHLETGLERIYDLYELEEEKQSEERSLSGSRWLQLGRTPGAPGFGLPLHSCRDRIHAPACSDARTRLMRRNVSYWAVCSQSACEYASVKSGRFASIFPCRLLDQ